LITYNAYSAVLPQSRQILLCAHSDFAAAARNLYAALHDMDTRGYKLIIAQKLPQSGIGAAVNDRLTRAAMK
jgi:L-threonylcarbamoyladenylate synthase